jgi:hypothetical protein
VKGKKLGVRREELEVGKEEVKDEIDGSISLLLTPHSSLNNSSLQFKTPGEF